MQQSPASPESSRSRGEEGVRPGPASSPQSPEGSTRHHVTGESHHSVPQGELDHCEALTQGHHQGHPNKKAPGQGLVGPIEAGPGGRFWYGGRAVSLMRRLVLELEAGRDTQVSEDQRRPNLGCPRGDCGVIGGLGGDRVRQVWPFGSGGQRARTVT